MSKVCVHVLFAAKEGREAQAAEQLNRLQKRSRQDTGCIQYEMHVSPDDPGRFMLYEQWESQAHLDAHLGMEYLAGFREETKEFLAADPVLSFWKPL